MTLYFSGYLAHITSMGVVGPWRMYRGSSGGCRKDIYDIRIKIISSV